MKLMSSLFCSMIFIFVVTFFELGSSLTIHYMQASVLTVEIKSGVYASFLDFQYINYCPLEMLIGKHGQMEW